MQRNPRLFDEHTPRRVPARMPIFQLSRLIVLAAAVAAAAAWALLHHYFRNAAPMLIPTQPAAAPTYDEEAGELPVPETIEADAN